MRFLVLALSFLQLSLAATYTVQHRVLIPAASTEAVFKRYGTFKVSDTAETGPSSDTLRLDKSGDEGRSVGGTTNGTWYQVLVKGEGLGEGIMSTMKFCYIYAGVPSLAIHKHNDRITSVDLLPKSSIPIDGSCPPQRDCPSNCHQAIFNVSIHPDVQARQPVVMFGPDLAPPIPVSTAPGGGPSPPPEEKSFLQKYWLPLLGVGFFIVSQLAPDDRPQQAGAAGAARR